MRLAGYQVIASALQFTIYMAGIARICELSTAMPCHACPGSGEQRSGKLVTGK